MNSERTILANYENIQVANHYANLLVSEGISCSVEALTTHYKNRQLFSYPVVYILKVAEADEALARVILQSDDPWFLPQIQAPIGHQYRLIGAVIAFVGFLCTFISLGTPQVKWIWFPLGIAGIGIFTFVRGILKEAEDFKQD